MHNCWFFLLTEGKVKSLHSRVEELDGEIPVDDRPWLADQLVHSLFTALTIALFVNVDPVSGAGSVSIDEYPKPNGVSGFRGPHDEVNVAGMEVVSDPTTGLVEGGSLFSQGPVTVKGPLVELEVWGRCVDMRFIVYCIAYGRKVLDRKSVV